MPATRSSALEDADYRKLLALRTALRQFMRWSETQAQETGLTPAQHQLLLAVRGHDDPRGPTIGDVAGYLLLRHHSAVELAQRAQALGLVARREDPDDRRVVRLALTDKGVEAIARLTSLHREELSRLGAEIGPLWAGLTGDGVPGSDRTAVRGAASRGRDSGPGRRAPDAARPAG